SSSYADSNVFF
nr:immunoglobulin light chain junction region [Macaca mulatta]